MVLVIGVTGGIASGKSSVCAQLKEVVAGLDAFSLVVIDGDKLGHRAYEVGTPCYDKLVTHFGPEVVAEDKQIDRRALGGIVFMDPAQMRQLESIVWPTIRGFIEAQLAELRSNSGEGRGEDASDSSPSSSSAVVVLEAAVMLEAAWEDLCDVLWITHVDPAVARERLMQRNSFTAEEADKRIHSQMTNAQRLARLRPDHGDAAVDNSGSPAALGVAVNEQFHLMMACRSPVFRFMSPLITKARSDSASLTDSHFRENVSISVNENSAARFPASPLSAAAAAAAAVAVEAATAGVAEATADSPSKKGKTG